MNRLRLVIIMKKFAICLLTAAVFVMCNGKKKIPDVSGIKVDLRLERFDEDFFSIDTLALDRSLTALRAKYPDFLSLFLQNIVGTDDANGITTYYRLYKPVFDSSQKLYKDFDREKSAIEHALKYVKYYFPTYKGPASLKTVLGPMNSMQDFAIMGNGDYTPDFLGPDYIGISLQFYLGKDFSLYRTEYFIDNVAPLFRSRRFGKEYILPDVMKLVAEDMFPDKSKGKPLIEQMIEKGKQWWMLDKLLPEVADSVKTGYTQQQLDWCKKNEGLIWTYLIKNEDIYSVNPTVIQTYIGEAPFTQGFSQELSPGNIGQWIGWQIVAKYEEKNPGLSPQEIMNSEPRKILEDTKYKPK